MKLSNLGEVWELDERRTDIKRVLAAVARGEEITVSFDRNDEIIPADNDSGRALVASFTAYLTTLLAEIEADMVKHGIEIDEQDTEQDAA